jgi:hypothetical protein
MKMLNLITVGLASVWLVAAAPAFADSSNGNGGGQDNGLGCGQGNTSAQDNGDCPGNSGGDGGDGGGGGGPCVAGDLTGCVTINAHVAADCAMTVGSDAIHLGEISNASSNLDTAVVNAGTASLAGFCNGTTSTMTVEASALTGPATTASGFTNIVNYTAKAALHGAPAVFATDDSSVTGAGSPATVGVFTDTIDVTLSNASSPTGMLVAGAYTGSVIVTLTPGA